MGSPVRFGSGPAARCAEIHIFAGPPSYETFKYRVCEPKTDDEAADERKLREKLADGVAAAIINDKWEN